VFLLQVAFASLLLFSGCGYNNTQVPEPDPLAKPNGNNAVNGSIVFADIKSQIFDPNCIRCHSVVGGNRAGINLETYSNVQPILQNIANAVSSGAMPPTGGLPNGLKNLVAQWIAAGAPEFATSVPPVNPGDPQSPGNPPTPCKVHMALERNGLIETIDANFYFEILSNKIKRRDDDCNDR
jgi:hypothetical protein